VAESFKRGDEPSEFHSLLKDSAPWSPSVSWWFSYYLSDLFAGDIVVDDKNDKKNSLVQRMTEKM
jgi:hypothetical protein